MLDLVKIHNLCPHVRNNIFEFIPKDTLLWVSRDYYQNNHCFLQRILTEKKMYDNYIRFIIRNDYDIIFNLIIGTHDISTWKRGAYKFRNIKYANYIHFLDCFMFRNNASKCRQLLFTNVYKKKYKKIQRNIAWSN